VGCQSSKGETAEITENDAQVLRAGWQREQRRKSSHGIARVHVEGQTIDSVRGDTAEVQELRSPLASGAGIASNCRLYFDLSAGGV
jgi:hypothetical protein